MSNTTVQDKEIEELCVPTYNVVEIFNSIDGESKRAGQLATFIRLHSCNLNCSYCDSTYACKEAYNEMTLYDIEQVVKDCGCLNITITGGEPLIQQHLYTLIKTLASTGHDVCVETNGSLTPPVEFCTWHNVWYSMDYKCPSSNMNKKMLSALDMSYCLQEKDTLKFVVGTEADLYSALGRMQLMEREYLNRGMPHDCRPTYYFSPVFGKIEPIVIVKFMQDTFLSDEFAELQNRIKIQLQLHKIIWPPEKRGV